MEFRKSSFSSDEGPDCVELRADNKDLLMRDSKSPDTGTLTLPRRALQGLLATASALAFLGIYGLGIAPISEPVQVAGSTGCASQTC